ncbi:MAG: formate/nitrite transporter family protein [Rhodobacteraceae bacterium]|nr:formate/nitrite transporter family protein [Alphaproteobacteria bacterium]NNK66618.1 formate/nitrite transporter family protein [Paracoccaceae bacterium]
MNSRPHDQTDSDLGAEEEAIEQAGKLAPKLIYEVIRRDGEEEMERPLSALFWSGIAAGILISLSVLGESIFRTYLPDAAWRYLLENVGYSLGFLVVILGRMQLFTENTITTVLPVMAEPTRANFLCSARLWGVVLFANVIGAFLVAAVFVWTSAIPDALRPAIEELSRHATEFAPMEGFMRAIPAGVLVAAIVWMLPQAKGGEFWVILTFTWLIAAGDFTHIVAGSVEMAYLALQAKIGFVDAVFGFFIPVFAGNVVGGTVIFALLAHSQVKEELDRREKRLEPHR